MLTDIAPYIAVAALVAAVVLGVLLYLVSRRQSELADRQRAVLGQRRAKDVVAYTLELDDRVQNLREAVTVLTEEVERYRHDLDASLSNIAVVRFDAFPDTGGRQSASIALLDNYRSGIVISIIASRESARLYVKFLDHGLPDRELAPEEEEAVRRSVPTALPRGELSRTPVSTFSRETRQLIEEARRAAELAQAAVAGETTGGQTHEGAGDQAGIAEEVSPDQLQLPRSAFAGSELGFAWYEAQSVQAHPVVGDGDEAKAELVADTPRALGYGREPAVPEEAVGLTGGANHRQAPAEPAGGAEGPAPGYAPEAPPAEKRTATTDHGAAVDEVAPSEDAAETTNEGGSSTAGDVHADDEGVPSAGGARTAGAVRAGDGDGLHATTARRTGNAEHGRTDHDAMAGGIPVVKPNGAVEERAAARLCGTDDNAGDIEEGGAADPNGAAVEGVPAEEAVPTEEGVAADEGLAADEGVAAEEGLAAEEGVAADEGVAAEEGVATEAGPAETERQRRARLHEDWLGGDELDF